MYLLLHTLATALREQQNLPAPNRANDDRLMYAAISVQFTTSIQLLLGLNDNEAKNWYSFPLPRDM